MDPKGLTDSLSPQLLLDLLRAWDRKNATLEKDWDSERQALEVISSAPNRSPPLGSFQGKLF